MLVLPTHADLELDTARPRSRGEAARRVSRPAGRSLASLFLSLALHAGGFALASWMYGEPQAAPAREFRDDGPLSVAIVAQPEKLEALPFARPEFEPVELAFDSEPIEAPFFEFEMPLDLPEPQRVEAPIAEAPLEPPAVVEIAPEPVAELPPETVAANAADDSIRALMNAVLAQGRPSAGVGSGGGGDASAPIGGSPRGANGAGGSSAGSGDASSAPAALGSPVGTGTAARVPISVAARVLDKPDPTYPRLSRRLNEEGVVELRLHVDVEGVVTAVDLVASSGYARLDEAAIEGVKLWKFAPATLDGRPVASTCPQRVRFELVAAR